MNIKNVQSIKKIYICHYPKLKERIDYLVPELNKFGFAEIDVVNGICRDNITEEDKKIFIFDAEFAKNRWKNFSCPLLNNLYQDDGMIKSSLILNENLKAVLANFLTHKEIWEKINKSDDEYALVLEDDAILIEDNFKNYWSELVSQIPEDLDIAYLHDGCGFTVENHIKIQPTKDILFYKCPTRMSRTCCSYLISKKFANSLLKNMYPVVFAIDHELNYLQNKLNANVYWTSPIFFHEGSGNKYTGSYTK